MAQHSGHARAERNHSRVFAGRNTSSCQAGAEASNYCPAVSQRRGFPLFTYHTAPENKKTSLLLLELFLILCWRPVEKCQSLRKCIFTDIWGRLGLQTVISRFSCSLLTQALSSRVEILRANVSKVAFLGLFSVMSRPEYCLSTSTWFSKVKLKMYKKYPKITAYLETK